MTCGDNINDDNIVMAMYVQCHVLNTIIGKNPKVQERLEHDYYDDEPKTGIEASEVDGWMIEVDVDVTLCIPLLNL